MTKDDVLFGYRLQLFALAAELGCREPAGRWACTARPTTAGRPRSTVRLSVMIEQRTLVRHGLNTGPSVRA
jgi:hypothetical protein